MLKVLRTAAEEGLIEVRRGRAPRVADGAAETARRLLGRQVPPSALPRVAILVPVHYFPLKNAFFYNVVVEAVAAESERVGLRAEVLPWQLETQREFAQSMVHGRFAAAIGIGVRRSYMAGLSVLWRQRFPMVVLNRRFPGLRMPTVRTDSYHAAQDLVGRLVELGHRNLCLVTGRSMDAENVYGYPAVFSGWVDALGEHGLLETCSMPVHVVPAVPLPPFGYQFQRLVRSPRRPTAIVFEHGHWATNCLSLPAFADLRIPDQVSVAAFDQMRAPPQGPHRISITTCRVNTRRTAACLVETVQRLLAGETDPPSIRVPLNFKLTGSIGPAPRGSPAVAAAGGSLPSSATA